MRILSANLQSIFAECRNPTFFHLVEIDFPSGKVYLVDDPNADHEYNNQTYIGGKLNRLENFTFTARPKTSDTSLEIPDGDRSIINLLLQGGWQGREVTVHRLYYSKDLSIKEAVLVQRQQLDSFSDANYTVKVETASKVWAYHVAVAGRKTNSTSQQQFYPDDNGFDPTPIIIKDIPFMRAKPTTVNGGGGSGPSDYQEPRAQH